MSRANLPIIPDSMTVNTGEQIKIEERMEAFFLEIIQYLGYDEDSAGAWCRIEHQMLCQFASELMHFNLVTSINTEHPPDKTTICAA